MHDPGSCLANMIVLRSKTTDFESSIVNKLVFSMLFRHFLISSPRPSDQIYCQMYAVKVLGIPAFSLISQYTLDKIA